MATLPTSAFCGDTIEFSATVESGSTGHAIFRHVDSGHVVKITPVISGADWTITVAPIDTAEAPAGLYAVALLAVDSSDVRETLSVGSINLAEPIDRPARASHVRKMVALLEAHIEGRIHDDQGRGLESYSIGGVPITKLSIMDARTLLTKYRADLETENIATRAALGLGTGRRVLTQFS